MFAHNDVQQSCTVAASRTAMRSTELRDGALSGPSESRRVHWQSMHPRPQCLVLRCEAAENHAYDVSTREECGVASNHIKTVHLASACFAIRVFSFEPHHAQAGWPFTTVNAVAQYVPHGVDVVDGFC